MLFARDEVNHECRKITSNLSKINNKFKHNQQQKQLKKLYLTESSILLSLNKHKHNCLDSSKFTKATEYNKVLETYMINLENAKSELSYQYSLSIFYHVNYQGLINALLDSNITPDNMVFFLDNNGEKTIFYEQYGLNELQKTQLDNLLEEIKIPIKESIKLIVQENTEQKNINNELNNIKSYSQKIPTQIQTYIFRTVRSLVDKGFDEKAIEELQEIIKTNPVIEIPQDLKYLHSKTTHVHDFAHLYKWILDSIDSAKYRLPGLIFFLLVVRFILLCLGQRWHWSWVNVRYVDYRKVIRLPLLIEINNFEYGLSPVVPEKNIESIIKGLLLKHTLAGENILNNISDEPIESFNTEFNFARSFNLPVQIFWNLVNVIIPKISFDISGHLLERSDKGFGLAVTCNLYNNESIKEFFWHNDYDPYRKLSRNNIDEILRLLAEPITIWILFNLDKKAAIQWSGGEIWHITALTYTGIFWQKRSEKENAENLFTMASSYSKFHNQEISAMERIAQFNLGQIALNSIYRHKISDKTTKDLIKCQNFFNNAVIGSIKYEANTSFFSDKKEFCVDIQVRDLQLSTLPVIWLLLRKYNCMAGILFLRKSLKSNKTEWVRRKYLHFDSIWYKSKYQLATIHIYQYFRLNDIDHLDKATNILIDILLAYKDTSADLINNDSHIAYQSDLLELIEYIYLLSNLLLGSLFIHYTSEPIRNESKIIDKLRELYRKKVKQDNYAENYIYNEIINNELAINFSQLTKISQLTSSDYIKQYLDNIEQLLNDNEQLLNDIRQLLNVNNQYLIEKYLIEKYLISKTKAYIRSKILINKNTSAKKEDFATVIQSKKSIAEEEEKLLSSHVHYSLACYYCDQYRSIINKQKIKKDEKIAVSTKEKIIHYLKLSFDLDKRLFLWFETDPSMEIFRDELFNEYMKICKEYSSK